MGIGRLLEILLTITRCVLGVTPDCSASTVAFVNGWHYVPLSTVCAWRFSRTQDAIATRSSRHASLAVLALQAGDGIAVEADTHAAMGNDDARRSATLRQ